MPKRKNRKAKRSPLPHKFKALDGKRYVLTPKQKHWCDVFLEEDTNLTIASLETYKITNKNLCKIPWGSLSDEDRERRARAENTAVQIGRENLRKLQIKNYIYKVLSDEGFTNDKVRLKHFRNMMQDKSISASNTAIDMYYKKTGTYAPEKVEHGVSEKLEKFLESVDKDLP